MAAKHDACGLCPICDRVCRHQRPCICDGRNEAPKRLEHLQAAAMAFGASTAKSCSDQRRAEVNELRLAAYAFAGQDGGAK